MKRNSVDHGKAQAERGAGRFGLLLLLAFAAAIVYLVAIFVPIYHGNEAMRAATEEILHRGALQNLKDDDVRAQLEEKARQCGLPYNRRVELWREGRAMVAKISFKHRVWFPFYTYEWPFEIRVRDHGL